MSEKTLERIFSALTSHPEATIAHLSAAIGVSNRTIERNLKRLQDQGRIRRVGPSRGGRWEIVNVKAKTWIGKDKQPALEPRILIEDPEKSYGDKAAENMLLFGDNLLALKALEQSFTGKIKCVCIDPPYNTGNAFDHYDDGLEHPIWLSLNQFHIYWKHNSRQFHPDFVAETSDAIYMIETKKEGDIDTAEVQEKSQAALAYCVHATEFTTQNNGKPWKNVLIPHDAVKLNKGFDSLAKYYEHKNGAMG